MLLIGEKILNLAQIKEAKIDSTLLEVSRYDKHADYNLYYGCRMDKSHITIVAAYLYIQPIQMVMHQILLNL